MSEEEAWAEGNYVWEWTRKFWYSQESSLLLFMRKMAYYKVRGGK